jgi:hypothetical protein
MLEDTTENVKKIPQDSEELSLCSFVSLVVSSKLFLLPAGGALFRRGTF